ncbi:hypothetical protein A5713_18030 [Mycobacterium sp. E2497]|nr:hypothetical protein A5713_18030 [Mycobacterium sp. E2497]
MLFHLIDFYKTFGTGFVARLDLVAYGVFEASLTRDSKFIQDVFKIGGGVAASLPFISAEAAAEYVQTHMDQNVQTIFNAQSFGSPPQAPPATWANNARQALNGKSIEEFLSGEAWSTAAPEQVAEPANPTLKSAPIDPSKLVDIPKLPSILGPAIEVLKHNILGISGSVESPAVPDETPAEITADVEGEQNTLKGYAESSQVAITGKAAETDKKADSEITDKAAQPVLGLRSVPDSGGDDSGNDGSGDTSGGRASGTAFDLGGYVVGGYRYLPWSEIFPKLKLSPALTMSQVVFGHSLAWLEIRGVFAQYLEFCAAFRGVTRNQSGDEVDIGNTASAFRLALDVVSESLTNELTDENAKLGLDFLQTLEAWLKEELDANDFDMYEHYQFWINNYEWLKRVAFGVVAVVEHDRQYFYQENPYPNCPLLHDPQPKGFTRATSIRAADLISHNAYRLYPIISTDVHGEPCFAWVGAPSRLTGDNEDERLRRSGLLTLSYRAPEFSPDGPKGNHPEDWYYVIGDAKPHVRGEFDQTVVPMLIHQSTAVADELLSAENATDFQGNFPSAEERLQERWNNRKAMFGMHLYPGVGDDTGFGPVERLLQVAGQLAHDATEYATVLPKKDETGTYGAIWDVQGVCAAYSAPEKHDAMFFWGPEAGPGKGLFKQDVFDQCAVKFIPVGYRAAKIAVKTALGAKGGGDLDRRFRPTELEAWMKAGGGPMWMKPRTELFDRLQELAGNKPPPEDY